MLQKSSDTKTSGNDGIPVRFLKSNLTVTASLILHTINLSIVSLKIPASSKSTTLTPLYKDGDRTDPVNYSPISILHVISKVLERVAHNQVHKYSSHDKILSDAQFGFRKGYSTSTCVWNLINTISNNMENGMMTGVLFLDLKKAFHTVNHNIMLQKLSMYGLGPMCVSWFKNSLSNRTHIVTCGVPQGCILGPWMFIVCINDMDKEITDCSISLYADDTALYYAHQSYVDLMLALWNDIDSVTQWLNLNKLNVNTKKNQQIYVIWHQKQAETSR